MMSPYVSDVSCVDPPKGPPLSSCQEQSRRSAAVELQHRWMERLAFLVLVMSLAFAIARLLFWIGYHRAPPLRAFGFAATFYPTVAAALWALVVWLF